jgi:hypothetical protein
VLFANRVEWRPRPVFQSYVAYTPSLLRLNADSYLAPGAPVNVLFAVEPWSNRYPNLDDALMWPILLTRFDIVDVRGQYLLLKPTRAREYRLHSLREVDARLGEDVGVPLGGSDLIWVSIDVQPSILGYLNAILFKPPPIFLETSMLTGEQEVYRLPRSMARTGFLLSPAVATTSDFGELASETRQGLLRRRGVRAFRVVTKADWSYHSRVGVRFWELSLPTQKLDQVPVWKADFPGLPLRPRGVEAAVPFRGVVGPEGRPVTYTEAPSRLIIDLPASVKRLAIAFGVVIKDGSAWNLTRSDRIEFRVSIGGLREPSILWSKTVSTDGPPDERGVLKARIDVPRAARGRPLILETLPAPTADTCWAFWSTVDVVEASDAE